MSKALYRKYRPTTFTDVCGQDRVSLTLKNQIAANKPSHAYLFTGSRGTGKTSSAKILAKAVNCLNAKDGDPCCECEMCKGIDNGSVLDVVEIDAASNNGVDNIRELRDNIAYLPVSAKYKVYIVDEVHMLTDGAFNALLKTLEEPPAHAIFILATTEVHKIPATILSRCQRYDFSRISAGVISQRLKYICNQEGITAEDTALDLIAKLADGGMRDAVSMLDLCAGVSGNVTEKSVAEAVGLIDKTYLFNIVELIENNDTASLLKEIDRLYNSSCDMERLCVDLVSHYRDLMIAKTTPDFRELITSTNEELDRIEKQAENIKFSNMMSAVAVLTECTKNMKSGGNKRILIETSLIKMCMPKLNTSLESLNSRVEQLEDKIKNGVNVISSNSVQIEPESNIAINKTTPLVEKKENTPVTSAEAKQEKVSVFTNWAEVMEKLSGINPMLYAVMNNSKAYIGTNIVLIDAPNSQFKPMINGNQRFYDAIREAVFSVTGKKYRIGPYKGQAVEDGEEEKSKADPLDVFAQKNKDFIETE